MSIPDTAISAGLEVINDRLPPNGPIDDFAGLTRPLGAEEFKARYWERKPFLIKRNIDGYFESIVSVDQIHALLASSIFHANDIRIAKDGQLVPAKELLAGDVIDRTRVMSHYAAGATIVFEHLNRKHAGLLQVMANCEQEFRLPFRANAYLTPAASKGFSLHYDTHDVLILQVSGTKSWQIYDNPVELPHEAQSFTSSMVDKAVLIGDIMLEPGDVLYLPRGFIHGARANEQASFHITAGIRSVTLRDVYAKALKHMLQSVPELRQVYLFSEIGSKAETARRTLLERIGEVDIRAALRNADSSFMKKRKRSYRGRLKQAVHPVEISPGTCLRIGKGVVCRLRESKQELVLSFDRRSIRFPIGARRALDMIVSGKPFRPVDLPGLEEESRLLLARHVFNARLLDIMPDFKTEDSQHSPRAPEQSAATVFE